MFKSASLSNDRTYRYLLVRTWDESKGFLNVIGLNPSTADECEDDPTIRRCIDFARRWGLGGLIMTNLFAYRATKPVDMLQAVEPVGEMNNAALKSAAAESKFILAAWGANGGYLGRDKQVIQMLPPMMCLKKTKGGHPGHPLYIPAETTPIAL